QAPPVANWGSPEVVYRSQHRGRVSEALTAHEVFGGTLVTSQVLDPVRPAQGDRAPRVPVPPAARLPRPLRLVLGLAGCAVAVWLSVRAGLGLSPWDVLHAGLAERAGLSFGTVLVA